MFFDQLAVDQPTNGLSNGSTNAISASQGRGYVGHQGVSLPPIRERCTRTVTTVEIPPNTPDTPWQGERLPASPRTRSRSRPGREPYPGVRHSGAGSGRREHVHARAFPGGVSAFRACDGHGERVTH
jgi:hypothetical protein